MTRKLLIVLPVLTVAAFIAVGAYLIFGTVKAPNQPTTFHLTASTKNYNLLLAVAPPQKMYTASQVSALHPTNGEVMFTGTMVMPGATSGAMGNMNMSNDGLNVPGWRHVEVHIFTRSNQVIADANPVVTIHDQATGKETDLPIVTMQGIVAGPSDFHYGNNAYLPSGHSYTVTVKVGGDTTSFHLQF